MDDWAMKRARALTANRERSAPRAGAILAGESDFLPSMEAFAAYIREHEQPPVDPDLNEAREIVRRNFVFGSGLDHKDMALETALAGIKRGRELEREGR